MAQSDLVLEKPQGGTGQAAREIEDDFYCLRFAVWYPSIDCAYRTRFRTCPGCDNCDQGRFNLKRHAGTLIRPTAFRPHRG